MTAMFGLWAVTRHTVKQCLRTKVAGLFILLLTVAMIILPFTMRGDGTLAGAVRTFLAYSTSITAMLLSLVTVFLTVGIVTGDVRQKLIFSVATKPVARWQYIAGRWAGVVLLNALLLAVAGGSIYGLSQYLRGREALNPTDRRTVETEVFTARARVAPQPLDVQGEVARRVQELRDKGEYDDVIASYIAYSPGDETLALQHLQQDLTMQISEAMQSVAPQKSVMWRFEGINVAERQRSATGTILNVNSGASVVVVQAEPKLVAQLIHSGPIRVDGADGRIVAVESDAFAVEFNKEQMAVGGDASRLAAGRQVELLIDPVIQLTFKTAASSNPPDNQLRGVWQMQNPSTGFTHLEDRSDPPMLPATLVVSTRVVDEAGKTALMYINPYPTATVRAFSTSVTILQNDVAVLYKVGSFGQNVARAMLLIWVQLAFLAGLGVLAASFLSFPVACVFTLFLLVVQRTMGFLMEATDPNPSPSAKPGVFDYFSHYIVLGLKWLLPGSEGPAPSDALVDGMQITSAAMADATLKTLAVVTTLLLLMACVIFSKRELARVQV